MAHVDQNLCVASVSHADELVWYDVRRQPLRLYGLYEPCAEGGFRRLPDAVGRRTNEGVTQLYTNTAGGRVRFATDASRVVLRAEMPNVTRFSHMPLSGTSGFDLYVDDPLTGESRYEKTFMPPSELQDGYMSEITFKSREMRYITIHFPLYNDVTNVWIGTEKTARMASGLSYRPLPPIVYYGSSITQGGCACRPGNAYQNILSRLLRVDHVNLGFSGSARGETNIAQYMAQLPMSAFVCDYDHNAPTPAHLQATHRALYETIRRANPTVPYIMLSRPDFAGSEDAVPRREIVRQTYAYALRQGDTRVYFLDGEQIFTGPFSDGCTVDGTHPNDFGFVKMAQALLPVLQEALAVTT